MTYSRHMTAARAGEFTYVRGYSRSRVQAKRLRTTAGTSSSAWEGEVSDVRNCTTTTVVGYDVCTNTTPAVSTDPYADLRDCMI